MTMNENITRGHILDIATELFAAKGKHGVSTAEIASAAGVNKALIFYYFNTKDDLYIAVFEKQINQLARSVIDALMREKPGSDRLIAFIRNHISIIGAKQHYFRLFMREILFTDDTSSYKLRNMAVSVLTEMRKILFESLQTARNNGEFRDVDPYQTLVSIISLDIFFFLGKPFIASMIPTEFLKDFERDRGEHVLDLVMNGLRAQQGDTND